MTEQLLAEQFCGGVLSVSRDGQNRGQGGGGDLLKDRLQKVLLCYTPEKPSILAKRRLHLCLEGLLWSFKVRILSQKVPDREPGVGQDRGVDGLRRQVDCPYLVSRQ